MSEKRSQQPGGNSSGNPWGMDRRQFLKWTALATGTATFAPWEAAAGPFTRADFEKLVPLDKKLSPAWLESLTARGTRAVYRGRELDKIGMPVGGLCAGQLYLGGDGKLWHWDIFNRHIGTGAEHYAKPMSPASPLEQGFALSINANGGRQVRKLDRSGWQEISFNGEYPLGFVDYRDPASPVEVSLEAFSPFIPLNVADSSLPVTVMRFRVKNTTASPVEAELAGWLENAVCLHSSSTQDGRRRNRVICGEKMVMLECAAEPPAEPKKQSARQDILFDDFERENYGDWKTTGEAFGSGPIEKSNVPAYQGSLRMHGQRAVNSHATAPGADVGQKDAQIGTLTSRAFTVERHFINFLIGGGARPGRTGMNLLIGGETVLSATGADNNQMTSRSWDVRRWAGQQAQLQIVDHERGGWGNIGVDHIVFSDAPATAPGPLAREADFGTMGLALLDDEPEGGRISATAGPIDARLLFTAGEAKLESFAPLSDKLVGAINRRFTLAAGQSLETTFLVTWHFPNLKLSESHGLTGRHYATRFNSALAVANYVATHLPTLREQTRRWHDTWYDSSLPYWFLDRTFLNTSILATATSLRLANGRFWGWEGVGCCHGTCGHVWQYAHAVARLFPELERDTRERVDFGLALQRDGAIFFRGEFNDIPAIDAQAGTILRALREHQMTTEGAWLQKNWPNIKKATEWLIAKDGDGDGLITGNQHNTLDTDWFGPVAWLSGLYLAALRAAEVMAKEVSDHTFASRCRDIYEPGAKKLTAELFDGEYYLNKPDPQRFDAINSGTGCHIDQVFAQSWAFQVGLDRVLPAQETLSALRSLWRYNFTPDVGPYRAVYKPGRWYAMPGEGGLLMCSFPRAGWDYTQAKGKGAEWAAGYFNECMNGFEYQAAGHMIWEGLLTEGLAITRMIHDRYHPLRRNPWNEIECGDHYARSMASYGVFLAACGYEYHGPNGRLAFAPRLKPEHFRAAFTTAQGWGTFSQRLEAQSHHAGLEVKWGNLQLRTLALGLTGNQKPSTVKSAIAGKAVASKLDVVDGRAEIHFPDGLQLKTGDRLEVELS